MSFKAMLKSGSVVVTLVAVMELSSLLASGQALAADVAKEEQPAQILFTNVNIFDGKSEKLKTGMNVLVEDNLIKTVSKDAKASNPEATVIDGGGRTLLPGFIDNHVHLVLTGANLSAIESMDWGQIAYASVPVAEMYLMEGFTTVRDAGGAPAALREAIDKGDLVGPRLYTALSFLGGRGGHADFATFSSEPEGKTNMNRLNMAQQVDGVDQTLLYARNNFRQGATQLKVMQSGGVVSLFDPWQMEGRTVEEIEAAVEIANQYDSYVMAHSYRKESILRALNAGVKTIEHGFMFDGEIAAVMKEKGAFITTNLTAFDPGLLDIPAVKGDPRTLHKAITASDAFVNYLDNVRKYKPKRGFHTDCVGAYKACRKQVAYEKYLNGDFFSNFRALVALTSVGGEIAALSGNIVNPYQDGKLGVIEEGAYADILLVDGNPLEDLSVIGAQDKWFDGPDRPEGVETIRIIMKDGVIYKNTLD
jgi:imidazolonepropionase-like amidohydrolase